MKRGMRLEREKWLETRNRFALRLRNWFPANQPIPAYQRVTVWVMFLVAVIALVCLWLSR